MPQLKKITTPPTPLPPTGTNEQIYSLSQAVGLYREESWVFNSKDYLAATSDFGGTVSNKFIRQFERRYAKIMLEFRERWKKEKAVFSPALHMEIQKYVGQLFAWVLSTNPSQMSIDITPDATVFCTVIYPDLNAYIELHPEDGETELVFNLYRAKKPVYAYGGPFLVSLSKYMGIIREF